MVLHMRWFVQNVFFRSRRTFSVITQCRMAGGTEKTVTACGATKLNDETRETSLKPLVKTGWSLVEKRDAIYKEFKFKNFNQAFGFMTRVALYCETKDHHPEWFNVYNKVEVTLTTHACHALSDKDIEMAKFMDVVEKTMK